jgi:hypothetical protein
MTHLIPGKDNHWNCLNRMGNCQQTLHNEIPVVRFFKLEWSEAESLDTLASNGSVIPALDDTWMWSSGGICLCYNAGSGYRSLHCLLYIVWATINSSEYFITSIPKLYSIENI